MYSSVYDIVVFVQVIAIIFVRTLQQYQFVCYACVSFDVHIYFASKYHGIMIGRIVTNRSGKKIINSESIMISKFFHIASLLSMNVPRTRSKQFQMETLSEHVLQESLCNFIVFMSTEAMN